MRKFLGAILLLLLLEQAAAAEKYTTLKGYLGSGNFGWQTVNNNYAGSHLRYEENWSIQTGNTFGFAVEQSVLRLKQQEILLGVSYLFPQEIRKVEAKAKLLGGSGQPGRGSLRGDFIDTNTIQVSSVYIKPRMFFSKITKYNPTATYVAAKLSYNAITLTGDLAGNVLRFDNNAIGYGLALGYVDRDTWEWEFSYDNVINPRLETTAIFLTDNDTLTGTYYLGQISVSIGYRL
ncbi:hypothetical protein NO1_1165 [Candidatus Termititenax aidoneus]|uniref:Outer membrane protein beta-barrel domain-containing protein n=1 Tax=Termititenax aidoneus TaxID=2218524 RepID=A0A388TDD1_TERA1|nr:hypothetical protein NO1_1165 [Candidatus Termititenax aidoneus]